MFLELIVRRNKQLLVSNASNDTDRASCTNCMSIFKQGKQLSLAHCDWPERSAVVVAVEHLSRYQYIRSIHVDAKHEYTYGLSFN
jgi:hypothetical protein